MSDDPLDLIALLEEHPTLSELRAALAADEDLCSKIYEVCVEDYRKVSKVPVHFSRASALLLANCMANGSVPLVASYDRDAFWRKLATPVFFYNEVEPALRQHRANRLEAAFAAPVDSLLPKAERARF